ncbi:MAG: hypothetical protein RBU30_12920 [Polyangia bacterium]|jgi:hypothetical protein|nr:hypothetical protein [Polyangia bacterium]
MDQPSIPLAPLRQLIQQIEAEIARALGRRYAIRLDLLDPTSLRELQRLLRDLEDERRMAIQKARLTPWRRP